MAFSRGPAVLCVWLLVAASVLPANSQAGPDDALFEDSLFRRCINWMLEGSGGALIDNLCIDTYAIPPPSLFLCARKVMTGFQSDADREGCALIFEENARKARAGFLR